MSRFLKSSTARIALVAGLFVVFAAGAAVLVFANSGPPPQQRLFDLQVVGNTMTPSSLNAYFGDTLTITVNADRAEEIHLHGYDKHFFPSPGQPITLTMPGNLSGTFVIEIESTSTPLGTLDVRPRGGLFGIGQPPDRSNTTVVKNLAGTVIQTGGTSLYNLSLEIGPLQAMYTPAQFNSEHPKSGEIMFSGQMQMPPGMEKMTNLAGMNPASFPPGWRHLEIHVYNRKTGDPVRGLNPVITLSNKLSGQSQPVPIVTMQGIKDGPKDFHYGNNVPMPPSQYLVHLQINDQEASFNVSF